MDINKGKVFIVTGGASGLGEGTARMLATHGATVVIADLQEDKGAALARELGGVFVKCDVSQEADGQAVVAKATSLGKLVGLVNCAGIAPAVKTVGKEGIAGLYWHSTNLGKWALLDGFTTILAPFGPCPSARTITRYKPSFSSAGSSNACRAPKGSICAGSTSVPVALIHAVNCSTSP